jgi:hypothetical protein
VVEGVQRLRDGAMVAEVDETPAMMGDDKGASDGEVPEISGAGAATQTRS